VLESAQYGHLMRNGSQSEVQEVSSISEAQETSIIESVVRAVELAEEALAQVSRIAIEEIRNGLESSHHISSAEREMRSALRQLVLAERELRSRPRGRQEGRDGQALNGDALDEAQLVSTILPSLPPAAKRS
jgi:hypothetical protein